MSIFTLLMRLRAIGRVITVFGELISRIGSAPSLTEIVRDESRSDTGQHPIAQDSLSSNGDKDEEPEADGFTEQTDQGDLFETPGSERP